MRTAWIGTICLMGSFLTGAVVAQKPLTVPLKDANGAEVGQVEVTQVGKDVQLAVRVHNLPAGDHGIHVHAGGSCVVPDFTSAGGHLNPDNKNHGFKNPAGHHAGDMTKNLIVVDNGTGNAKFLTSDISLKPGVPNSIFGKTIVIHQSGDDQMTDPSGASGKRIACGVVPMDAM